MEAGWEGLPGLEAESPPSGGWWVGAFPDAPPCELGPRAGGHVLHCLRDRDSLSSLTLIKVEPKPQEENVRACGSPWGQWAQSYWIRAQGVAVAFTTGE